MIFTAANLPPLVVSAGPERSSISTEVPLASHESCA
jgi:hypothetical protein